MLGMILTLFVTPRHTFYHYQQFVLVFVRISRYNIWFNIIRRNDNIFSYDGSRQKIQIYMLHVCLFYTYINVQYGTEIDF